MDRPRRLWLAIALQALLALVLGGASVVLALASPAFLFFGFLLLFLAAILGALALLAVAGLVGTWRGTPAGFWTSLAAHALVALGVAGLMVDQAAGGFNALLPGLVVLGVVATSAGLVLSPEAREWYGV